MAERGRPKTLHNSITTCVVLEREELVNFKNKNDMDLSEFVRMAIKKDTGYESLDMHKALDNVFRDLSQIERSCMSMESLENNAYFLSVNESRPIEQKDEIIHNIKMLKSKYEEVYKQLFYLSVDISNLNSKFSKELTTGDSELTENCRSKIKPINNPKVGNVFHHMHLNLNGGYDRNVGVYIPYNLHRSVKHSSISKEGMRDMNKKALLWLCGQDII